MEKKHTTHTAFLISINSLLVGVNAIKSTRKLLFEMQRERKICAILITVSSLDRKIQLKKKSNEIERRKKSYEKSTRQLVSPTSYQYAS